MKTELTLSASTADRWLLCPPSVWHNKANRKITGVGNNATNRKEWSETTKNAKTAEGTIAHKVAEAYIRAKGATPNLDGLIGITDEMIAYAKIYKDKVDAVSGGYHITAIEQVIPYNDWILGGKGICDCLVYSYETGMHVFEYKYGYATRVKAKYNWQLILYALGSLHNYEKYIRHANGEIMITFHVVQPKLDNYDEWVVSLRSLLWIGERIKERVSLVITGKGEYKAGTHCLTCEHAGKCAKYAESSINRTFKADSSVLDNEELAELLDIISTIEPFITATKNEAKARILSGETVRGYDCKAGGTGKRMWADNDKAIKNLINRGYALEDIADTKPKTPLQLEKRYGREIFCGGLGDLVKSSESHPKLIKTE